MPTSFEHGYRLCGEQNLSVQFSIYNILDREYYDQESASDKYYAGDRRTFTLPRDILSKINFSL